MMESLDKAHRRPSGYTDDDYKTSRALNLLLKSFKHKDRMLLYRYEGELKKLRELHKKPPYNQPILVKIRNMFLIKRKITDESPKTTTLA